MFLFLMPQLFVGLVLIDIVVTFLLYRSSIRVCEKLETRVNIAHDTAHRLIRDMRKLERDVAELKAKKVTRRRKTKDERVNKDGSSKSL